MNHDEVRSKLRDRSYRKRNGCLEWIAGQDWDGYGMIRIGGIQYRAHRLSWYLTNGDIPEGMVVRHVCDNPPCIDVEHLRLGTYSDNAKDREIRGRSSDRRGDLCPTAKLNWDLVREIRSRASIGESHLSLASDYNVSRKTVDLIVKGVRWKENEA